MKATFCKQKAHGIITVPPSKSISHRALICRYLAGGGELENLAENDDVTATKNALSDGLSDFDCGDSASTLRFLLPLCMDGREHKLYASNRLIERVKGDLFAGEIHDGYIRICEKLTPKIYKIRGDISSQTASGLMLALPLLDGDSAVEFTTEVCSYPYLEMTADVMRRYGVFAELYGGCIKIKGNQRYKITDFSVEGDWSQAPFFDAFNLLGGDVILRNLNTESTQGDKIYREYYEELPCNCPVQGVSDYPDLAPVLMVLMATQNGGTLLGTHRLRYKECDRAQCMATELGKCGVTVIVNDDSITVGCGAKAPTEELCSHGDHRIAMALTVLLTHVGGTLDGIECVNKSMPDFFERLEGIGIKYEYEV